MDPKSVTREELEAAEKNARRLEVWLKAAELMKGAGVVPPPRRKLRGHGTSSYTEDDSVVTSGGKSPKAEGSAQSGDMNPGPPPGARLASRAPSINSKLPSVPRMTGTGSRGSATGSASRSPERGRPPMSSGGKGSGAASGGNALSPMMALLVPALGRRAASNDRASPEPERRRSSRGRNRRDPSSDSASDSESQLSDGGSRSDSTYSWSEDVKEAGVALAPAPGEEEGDVRVVTERRNGSVALSPRVSLTASVTSPSHLSHASTSRGVEDTGRKGLSLPLVATVPPFPPASVIECDTPIPTVNPLASPSQSSIPPPAPLASVQPREVLSSGDAASRVSASVASAPSASSVVAQVSAPRASVVSSEHDGDGDSADCLPGGEANNQAQGGEGSGATLSGAASLAVLVSQSAKARRLRSPSPAPLPGLPSPPNMFSPRLRIPLRQGVEPQPPLLDGVLHSFRISRGRVRVDAREAPSVRRSGHTLRGVSDHRHGGDGRRSRSRSRSRRPSAEHHCSCCKRAKRRNATTRMPSSKHRGGKRHSHSRTRSRDSAGSASEGEQAEAAALAEHEPSVVCSAGCAGCACGRPLDLTSLHEALIGPDDGMGDSILGASEYLEDNGVWEDEFRADATAGNTSGEKRRDKKPAQHKPTRAKGRPTGGDIGQHHGHKHASGSSHPAHVRHGAVVRADAPASLAKAESDTSSVQINLGPPLRVSVSAPMPCDHCGACPPLGSPTGSGGRDGEAREKRYPSPLSRLRAFGPARVREHGCAVPSCGTSVPSPSLATTATPPAAPSTRTRRRKKAQDAAAVAARVSEATRAVDPSGLSSPSAAMKKCEKQLAELQSMLVAYKHNDVIVREIEKFKGRLTELASVLSPHGSARSHKARTGAPPLTVPPR